ncbi:CopG family transcriptional regulator [Bradyrhizobium diazoefficiens]|uniref:ribbon-helix-helix domain-containing protein n=1 Tax=Bradyrhizobium diazoefficiens TaxID=1355477 RepID=UPI0004B0BB8D|nr:CopG family transcriptional regulator [Bradyrhizobium diazoefficiens]
MGQDGKHAQRVTTTLRKDRYAQLVAVAKKRDVALSWLIRHAVEKFLEEEGGGPRLPFEEPNHGKR